MSEDYIPLIIILLPFVGGVIGLGCITLYHKIKKKGTESE